MIDRLIDLISVIWYINILGVAIKLYNKYSYHYYYYYYLINWFDISHLLY